MTLSCTKCQSEFADWYPHGRCRDCGSQLRNDATGDLVPLPTPETEADSDAELDTWIAERDSLVVATSNEVPGYEAVAFHGEVMGITVLAPNVISNLGANVRKIVGGEVGVYVQILTDARKVALTRMRTEAMNRGANAVIAARLDANQIINGVTELIAYGTAVTIRPRDSDLP